MSLAVRMAERHVPAVVRRAALRALFATTADAFGCPVPPLAGLDADELLRRYALFTRDQAERAIRDGQDLPALMVRLEQGARALGARLRAGLRLGTTEEALAAAGWCIGCSTSTSAPPRRARSPSGAAPSAPSTAPRCANWSARWTRGSWPA
jgi:hypothetical protein